MIDGSHSKWGGSVAFYFTLLPCNPLMHKPQMSKSAMWYQQQMREEEKEEKRITAEYLRLLAQQNAVFNPNFSMGDGNTGDNEVDCGSHDSWDD